jgi:hypothetical protein
MRIELEKPLKRPDHAVPLPATLKREKIPTGSFVNQPMISERLRAASA